MGSLSVFVNSWLNAYRGDLGLREIRRELRDIPARKLLAWYETADYVIDIAAWDQGRCLGIMVLDKQSDHMIYAVGGGCENDDEVYARLDAFVRWLSSHQEPSITAVALDFIQQASAA